MQIEHMILRLALSVVIGGIIGMERGRHGRAAGMRTHILVCLGATMAAMTGLFINSELGDTGDISRIAAQVISGVGFLGAGMIILKNGSVVTGLTTAAGVWTTATIGIALGYGFYLGAGIAAFMFLITTLLLAKLERTKQKSELIYFEIENMHTLNETLKEIEETFLISGDYVIVSPKSGKQGNLGINITVEKKLKIKPEMLCKIKNVVFAVSLERT